MESPLKSGRFEAEDTVEASASAQASGLTTPRELGQVVGSIAFYLVVAVDIVTLFVWLRRRRLAAHWLLPTGTL
jgi:hypothetical protein